MRSPFRAIPPVARNAEPSIRSSTAYPSSLRRSSARSTFTSANTSMPSSRARTVHSRTGGSRTSSGSSRAQGARWWRAVPGRRCRRVRRDRDRGGATGMCLRSAVTCRSRACSPRGVSPTARRGRSCDFVVCAAEALPFPDAAFGSASAVRSSSTSMTTGRRRRDRPCRAAGGSRLADGAARIPVHATAALAVLLVHDRRIGHKRHYTANGRSLGCRGRPRARADHVHRPSREGAAGCSDQGLPRRCGSRDPPRGGVSNVWIGGRSAAPGVRCSECGLPPRGLRGPISWPFVPGPDIQPVAQPAGARQLVARIRGFPRGSSRGDPLGRDDRAQRLWLLVQRRVYPLSRLHRLR